VVGWLVLAVSNLEVFDKAVDPTLAGTLAGLSLAAAAFLSSFRAIVDDQALSLARSAISPGLTDEERRSLNAASDRKKTESENLGSAIVSLTVSFGCFVFLLAESLTLGDFVEPHALVGVGRALVADVVLEASTLTIGIVLLGLGAKQIASAARR
jgi:hypothetical protein